MESVVLIIHLFLALAIIGLVLLQRSEGGGLGIGGGGGMGKLASAQSTANILTRTTAICASLFFLTSLVLGILAGTHTKPTSLLDQLEETPAPVTAPADIEAPVAGSDEAEKPAESNKAKKAPAAPIAE